MPTNPTIEDGVVDRADAEIYEPPPCDLVAEVEYGAGGRLACAICPAGKTPTPEPTEWIAASGASFVELEDWR